MQVLRCPLPVVGFRRLHEPLDAGAWDAPVELVDGTGGWPRGERLVGLGLLLGLRRRLRIDQLLDLGLLPRRTDEGKGRQAQGRALAYAGSQTSPIEMGGAAFNRSR
jgi:hypothetical protein